ncbi:hypothetical protein OG585_49405 (plasmid) [Streptomyces sp. NBC_01340]|uniref:hypothetical protein n=1 Tax=unclassified Streptomyces TaxID=2593676 RepID=UPI00225A88FF|nr:MULTISPECIES: hypothetical protein [unclassified Streptomyces]MCX4597735.1 hypothetical protein [Streptomyces sp. NBC_01549]WSI44972.1 hypothetical protein OG585_49405 [Streptomyces sp. NBC_01340]
MGERRGGGLDTAGGDSAATAARAWRTVRSAMWVSLLVTAWTALSQSSLNAALDGCADVDSRTSGLPAPARPYVS